jgi:hypothetical protein
VIPNQSKSTLKSPCRVPNLTESCFCFASLGAYPYMEITTLSALYTPGLFRKKLYPSLQKVFYQVSLLITIHWITQVEKHHAVSLTVHMPASRVAAFSEFEHLCNGSMLVFSISYNVLPPFQIVGCFGFSRYICYVSRHNVYLLDG